MSEAKVTVSDLIDYLSQMARPDKVQVVLSEDEVTEPGTEYLDLSWAFANWTSAGGP